MIQYIKINIRWCIVMKITEMRLLNIRIFDEDKIVYEGMTEDVPLQYKEVPVNIVSTGNVIDVKIIK